MKTLALISLLTIASAIAGCDKPKEGEAQTNQPPAMCAKDIDCKGDRICESGQCIAPTPPATVAPVPAAPAAPSVAYEAVLISDDSAGPFTTAYMDLGTALNYQSRAGVANLMEQVVEDPEATGYVKIEKVYAFGPGRYVLIVSTGESGNSCPAMTYVFSYDTAGEVVDSKALIDGCSETVEAFAEGNKLSIKKEGATTVVFNGKVD
ncbi:hypothetical protein [Zestomonas thermotolerans]|uniref:hypothetical protein n=1 Tax=Zestomonas thermotolerans TaxID=157784 RepID=UPI0009DE976B|nr:hypothetical protein [Pseudomonas thermotolerans]